MKVFIVDYGCRPQAMGLPFHYSELGHQVYMLAPGEFKDEFDWSRIPIWPRLLHKSGPESEERNLANYDMKEFGFGEDYFLLEERDEILKTTYKSKSHVTLVTEEDLKTLGEQIDIFHTTEFCKPVLSERLEWAKKWLPNSKWVSSCVDPSNLGKGHQDPQPNNVCMILPSPCENMFDGQNLNLTYMFRNDFEFDLLGVDRSTPRSKNEISSFMHNFHVRDPQYYDLFCQLQEGFEKFDIKLTNYGGNIRGHGADVRYNEGGDEGVGPSGSNFKTLSVRKCAQKYYESRAVLHLKGLDWGGGVPAHAQISGTPMITITPFLAASNYAKFYNPETGTLACNQAQEIVDAIFFVVKNDEAHAELSKRMLELGNTFFTTEYWDNWKAFLGDLK